MLIIFKLYSSLNLYGCKNDSSVYSFSTCDIDGTFILVQWDYGYGLLLTIVASLITLFVSLGK